MTGINCNDGDSVKKKTISFYIWKFENMKEGKRGAGNVLGKDPLRWYTCVPSCVGK